VPCATDPSAIVQLKIRRVDESFIETELCCVTDTDTDTDGHQAKGEGTHFLIPWLQRAILYDVRIKPRVSGGRCSTSTRG
jgi:regulator of protease activity HflC (stomatin/prohibitin superfamily)